MKGGALGAPVRDGLWVAGAAWLLRLLLVLLFGGDVPPADDGAFYQVVAERIANGEGYTWRWPDGVVTFAAHYPVGYAGLLGGAYALFGPSPQVGMLVNALLEGLAVLATHRVAARVAGRRGALVAAGIVALSPTALGYTLALMTEGAAKTGWILATWLALIVAESERGGWTRRGALLGLIAVLGATTLVRPQGLLLAPVLGWIAASDERLVRRAGSAVVVGALSLAVCLPWTLRNCARMDRCVFVSANGGWNLLIGTYPEGGGAFVPITGERVPERCREVFAEAAKDVCFGAAAKERVLEAPGRWLRLVPAKLEHTFGFTASASAYLGAAGAKISEEARRGLSAAEIGFRRVLMALALWGAWREAAGVHGGRGARGRSLLRAAVAAAGVSCLLGESAWLSPLAFLALVGSRRELGRSPVLLAAGGAVAVTVVVHAVFFGAGRYSMVLEPLWAVVAAFAWTRHRAEPSGDRSRASSTDRFRAERGEAAPVEAADAAREGLAPVETAALPAAACTCMNG